MMDLLYDFQSTLLSTINRFTSSHFYLSIIVATLTLLLYWLSFGKSQNQHKKDLEYQLRLANRTVEELEEKLISLELNEGKRSNLVSSTSNISNASTKEIRIWMDGAFDMMHYGHMNAFRQGKSLGTKLIVGVNSDETITICKGKPVMNDEERVEMVRGCRWVDEVVSGVPYIMNDEYLQWVIETYKIDYVVHGDDPCIVDGKDVYESAQKMGKYLTIPRTEGISTTDIVGRMLLMTKTHHSLSEDLTMAIIPSTSLSSTLVKDLNSESNLIDMNGVGNKLVSKRNVSTNSSSNLSSNGLNSKPINNNSSAPTPYSTFYRKSNFLTTSRIIRLFAASVKAPTKDDKIVYLAGAWDMFHAGHVDILKKSRDYGSYVIVGVHSDAVVNEHRGHNLPILNLHERLLSVLGCKYVDDVLLDAPYEITKDFLVALNVSVVVKGSIDPTADIETEIESVAVLENHKRVRKEGEEQMKEQEQEDDEDDDDNDDPYKVPRQLGILRIVDIYRKLSVMDIVGRIQQQRERYVQKYAKKKVQEDEYYQNKYESRNK